MNLFRFIFNELEIQKVFSIPKVTDINQMKYKQPYAGWWNTYQVKAHIGNICPVLYGVFNCF